MYSTWVFYLFIPFILQLECELDFVAIYDGNNSLAPLLAQYDGCDVPNDVTATSGNMFVDFRSDFSVVNHGFKATITSG